MNVEKIATQLGRLETKVDGINQRLDVMNGTVADSKKRLRILEDANLLNTSLGKVRSFLLNNAVGIGSAVLVAYLIFKLNLS